MTFVPLEKYRKSERQKKIINCYRKKKNNSCENYRTDCSL